MDPSAACRLFFSEHPPDSQGGCLLAVSGGMDSMILLDVLTELGVPFAVAHCNFKLRAQESDDDETFVKTSCAQKKIPFFSKAFDVSAYSQQHKKGIQEAARELRYAWFDELCRSHGFSWIVTAHHQQDSVETMIMNMSRGTGVKGLRGILPVNGRIIRPLLSCTRDDLLTYCSRQGIRFREDSSNAKKDYTRNLVRQELIPLLRKVNSNAIDHLAMIGRDMQHVYTILETIVDSFIRQHTITKDHALLIPVQAIREHAASSLILYEILNRYHFNRFQVQDILNALDKESGKRFYSQTHMLIKDREHLIITERGIDPGRAFYLVDRESTDLHTTHLHFQFGWSPDVAREFDPGSLYFDASLIRFPITIRVWEKGDKMIPLGMTGFKKVSDILIDRKIPLHEKDHTWVVLSGEDIIAVIGHRIDDRYKITASTKEFFTITALKQQNP